MRFRGLLTALLVASSTASAEPCDALPRIAIAPCRAGYSSEHSGDAAGALRAWDAVLRVDEAFIPALAGRARALGALERYAEAETAWRQLGVDDEAYEQLGRLQLAQGRTDEALSTFRKLEELSIAQPGRALLLQALTQARSDTSAALDTVARALAFQGTEEHETLLREVISEVVSSAEKNPDTGVMLQVLRALHEVVDAPWLDELQQEVELTRLAHELMNQAGVPPTAAQRETLAEARERFARGNMVAARAQLQAMTREAPLVAEAWVALADTLLAMGEVAEAEAAARTAVRLDSFHAEPARSLGLLLGTRAGGRFDEEAQYWLDRALKVNPGLRDVRETRAEVLLRLGRRDEATAELRRLADGTQDGSAQRARATLADLAWTPAPVPRDEVSRSAPTGVPSEVWEGYWRALALDSRGQTSEARRVLADLENTLETYPPSLNLQARLQLAAGEQEQALATYRRSLELIPDQPAVMTVLGLYATGPERERLWQQAAALGDAGAHYFLARDAVERWQLYEAEAHLDAYFRGVTSGAEYSAATALRQHIAQRRQALLVLAILGGFILVATPLGLRWRRRRGVSLDQLLERHPECYADVARAVSAVRHEVLKHNATVLTTVADDLEAGRTERGIWAVERLLGPEGARARLLAYVDTLETIGRRQGVRVNLAWADARFAPILGAMDEVVAVRRRLARGDPRVAPIIRAAGAVLTGEAFDELGRWLTGLCLVPVTAHFVEEVWEGVTREPAFQASMEPEFSLEVSEDVSVRIFPDELRDILANLLRNALQASLSAGELRIGVRVGIVEDPITCVQWVEIGVLDDVQSGLTTSQLRGRYLERGLGLTVDLISKNSGSIRVAGAPGWAKMVAVRLPLAEQEVR